MGAGGVRVGHHGCMTASVGWFVFALGVLAFVGGIGLDSPAVTLGGIVCAAAGLLVLVAAAVWRRQQRIRIVQVP